MLKAHIVSVSQKNIYKHNIKDLYASHKLIYSMFECTRTEEELRASVPSGFCWLELAPSPFGKKYLVISDREIQQVPDVDIQTKEIPDRLFEADEYSFHIKISPVYRKRLPMDETNIKKKGPLIFMNDPFEIQEWFRARALVNGFEVGELHVGRVFTQVINKGGKKIVVPSVQIKGDLAVKDREKFQIAFKEGMGRGRAFGCGLLQIFPKYIPN